MYGLKHEICSHSFVLNISDVLSSLTITGWLKFLVIVRHKRAKRRLKIVFSFPVWIPFVLQLGEVYI